MAAGIPGARFVALPGRNHLFLETEPAFGQFLEHTRAFLATWAARQTAGAKAALAAIKSPLARTVYGL